MTAGGIGKWNVVTGRTSVVTGVAEIATKVHNPTGRRQALRAIVGSGVWKDVAGIEQEAYLC